jgi:hypothetical protein
MTAIALPPDVIERDHDLDQKINLFDRRHAEARAERNRLRWEWTRCPNGPMLTDADYGEQVGKDRRTISASANEHEVSVKRSPGGRFTECLYGEPHDPSKVEDLPDEQPHEWTTEELTAAADASHRARVGDRKATIQQEYARLRGTTIHTVTGNATHTEPVAAILAEANATIPVGAPDELDRLHALCRSQWEEWKHDEEACRRVQQWMKENRALDRVPAKSLGQAMVRTIRERMTEHGITFDEAEEQVRDWDRKSREAERMTNLAAARLARAVLRLRHAATNLRVAALEVTAAALEVEREGADLTDDFRSSVADDIDAAMTAAGLARTAVGEDSGVDWDAQARDLLNTEGVEE